MNGYLREEERLFLKLPQNPKELEEVIDESRSKEGASGFWINEGAIEIIEKLAKRGNEASIKMLYTLLKSPCAKGLESHNMANFLIYAPEGLMEKHAEGILRHVLIDEPHFEKEKDIVGLIDDFKRLIKKNVFEKNPDMEERINAIQEEALSRLVLPVEEKTEALGVEEEDPDSTSIFIATNLGFVDNVLESVQVAPKEADSAVKEDAGTIDDEKEEMMALQKISDGVPLAEKNKGKEMIKFFLSKAKEFKNKIGQFFGGGDNHDDR